MRKSIILLVSCLVVFASCQKKADVFIMGEKGNPQSPHKILIAYDRSGYKTKLVNAVIAQLGTDENYYRVTGLDELETAALDGYQAVLIIATIKYSRLDNHVTGFIEKNAADPRIVLFYTLSNGNTPPAEFSGSKLGLDVVTSASVVDYADQRAVVLAKLIKERLIE